MAFDPKNYPPDWRLRRRFIIDYRARGCCEWCGAVNREAHPATGKTVTLTIAHVWDKRPAMASLLNLAALCQPCHLRWDAADHARSRLRKRVIRLLLAGQLPLPRPPVDSLGAELFEELVQSGALPPVELQMQIPATAYELVGQVFSRETRSANGSQSHQAGRPRMQLVRKAAIAGLHPDNDGMAHRAANHKLQQGLREVRPTMGSRSRAMSVEIYCVKCKAKTGSREVTAVTMKNGRPAATAVCVDCGTKKFRIGALREATG